MPRSSSSCGSNYIQPNFQKIVSESEVGRGQLHLNQSDVDAFIKPYMSPGHFASLATVGDYTRIVAFDVKTERAFAVKLERARNGYLLMGNGVNNMIRNNIFVAGYEVAFCWQNGALIVYRNN